ncbi:MAG: serine/threonine protein kinase, partial [Myxococcales bacterium]|nr:serine/threonine protein kinase [Myxococcales bacterium]
MADSEDEELPPLAVGTVLEDRYRITGELGVGGIGAVYRAEHLRLGHHVAIKALRSAYAGHATMRPRFEREAKALAALKHPHIVAINDYSVAEGTPYLVMELLEGQTLEDLLAKGPLDEDTARDIASQMLEALIYAHAEGFVHRDLKPANVFLCELPTNPHFVKILDFGFVKLVFDDTPEAKGPLTHSGVAFGTPSYMSPEQATGDTTDARTDLYAFGVILYEMLAGRRPFVGSMPEIVRQQLVEPLPPLHAGGRGVLASRELRELLEKATAKERADRYASAEELHEALLALPSPWVEPRPGGEDDTLPPPPGERAVSQPTVRVGRGASEPEEPAPPPPRRRSNAPIFVGIAIGVLALGSVGVWVALREATPDPRAALTTATPPSSPPAGPVLDGPPEEPLPEVVEEPPPDVVEEPPPDVVEEPP